MGYSDSFSVQWDRLVTDFIASIRNYTAEMISVDRLNDWYKTNSFRWSSIAENEGILLDREDNAALKNELLEALSEFSFHKVELPPKPHTWFYVGTGAVVAVVLGAAIRLLLQQNFLFALIGAIAGFVVPIVIYAKKLDDHNKKQCKMIVEGYSNQLIACKEHLMRICKKFE